MTTTLIAVTLAAVFLMLVLLIVLLGSVSAVSRRSREQLSVMSEYSGRMEAQSRLLRESLEKLDFELNEDTHRLRSENATQTRQMREEVIAGVKSQSEALLRRLEWLGADLKEREGASRQYLERVDGALERQQRATAEEAARTRTESLGQAKLLREELVRHLKEQGDSLTERVAELTIAMRNQQFDFHKQVGSLSQATDRRMVEMQQVFEKQVERLEQGVDAKLEQMRNAVDEQVQLTMDRGLGDSFQVVRQQLENVQHNLKEMQVLAANVSDFRRVLTNVSSLGSWGVVRLSSLLEQTLAPGQYNADVKIKDDSEDRVKFAVRLPGREPGDDNAVWLPLDAEFPLDAYQRLVAARDLDMDVEAATAALEAAVATRAEAVSQRFLDPPRTTDFAVMFLPVEGLYAEVLHRQGLAEMLQREYRVVVCGPTTLAALLNSLQMGFRTLDIEQRSGEVWRLLGAVRTQFDDFGRVLGSVQSKLQEASSSINEVTTSARAIREQLQDVPSLSSKGTWAKPVELAHEPERQAANADEAESTPSPEPATVRVEHTDDA